VARLPNISVTDVHLSLFVTGVTLPDDRLPSCPMHLRAEEVEQLQNLAAHEETLLSVAKTHIALIMVSHVAKWLSAILGALVLLKGIAEW
jgi:hypothetical protein